MTSATLSTTPMLVEIRHVRTFSSLHYGSGEERNARLGWRTERDSHTTCRLCVSEQTARDPCCFVAPIDVVADDDERVVDDARHRVVGTKLGTELACKGTHRTRAARGDDIAQHDEPDPALDSSSVCDRHLDAVEEQREPRQARCRIEQGSVLCHAGFQHIVRNQGHHQNHIKRVTRETYLPRKRPRSLTGYGFDKAASSVP